MHPDRKVCRSFLMIQFIVSAGLSLLMVVQIAYEQQANHYETG